MKGVKKETIITSISAFFPKFFFKIIRLYPNPAQVTFFFALFFGNFELPLVTTSLDFLKSPSLLISVYYLSRSSIYVGRANQNSLITYSSTEISVFFSFGVSLLAQDLELVEKK